MKVNGIIDWGIVFWKMYFRMILDCYFLYVFIFVIFRLVVRSYCRNIFSLVNCFDIEFIRVLVVLFGDKMLFYIRILICFIKYWFVIWVDVCFDNIYFLFLLFNI